ncbi:MAG: pilin [Candidatus Paceibacterota bacterium]|jgi:hypothetical protein
MKKLLIAVSTFAMPFVAMAQAKVNSIWDLFAMASAVLNKLVPFIISLAVVYFIWGVFRYAVAGDEEKKKEAKTQIIWGIVGIFVMVSVWGLVNILQGTFGTAGIQSGRVDQLLPPF